MPGTMIERIIGARSGKEVSAGDIVDVFIDVRAARDFGGANVVKNLRDNCLEVDDVDRTVFTFDCNPGGSDQKYAANQQTCRMFAREKGIKVHDIDSGIGTHVAIEDGLVKPGDVFVSTDSHANIMGAIGAFGQGMGDVDIAAAFANGKVWFKVPRSLKLTLVGMPGPNATSKDVTLRMLQELGANGLLGYAADLYGEYVDTLDLAGRITIASMCTEMGGIITFIPPNGELLEELGVDGDVAVPETDASYDHELTIDITGTGPMAARPGHPEDTVDLNELKGAPIDSAFIGSCTNGRYEDLKAAADLLEGKRIAPGVVLKIVPATRKVWQRCLDEGIIETFMKAGALVGNAGCAGCAAGQIGQNGPGEVTISTGNRNYRGKQGGGSVYLASPATVAASALAGYITSADDIPDVAPARKEADTLTEPVCSAAGLTITEQSVATSFTGRIWYIPVDNIDTDMIFHNRYLAITDISKMGQYAFDNLEGYEDFASRAKPGDIIVVGKNFGAGSSRQQAVDCFKALGITVILAESFGAIYERNAINAGMPIMTYSPGEGIFDDGDEVEIDLVTGEVRNTTKGTDIEVASFSEVQMEIYRRGGLLKEVK